MAAGGGHWVKVGSGPMAGKMAFVPAPKSGTLHFGKNDYEAKYVGSLIVAKLQSNPNVAPQYQLVYKDANGNLKPIQHKGKTAVFDKESQALTKAENMHKLGVTKAIKGGSGFDVNEIAHEANLKKTGKTPKVTEPGAKTAKTTKPTVTEPGVKNIKAETAAAQAQAQAGKQFTNEADFQANKAQITVTTSYYKNKVQVDGVMLDSKGEYAVTYNQHTGKYHLVEMAGGTTVSTHATAGEAFTTGYTALKNNRPAAANPAFKDCETIYGNTNQANAVFAKHFSTQYQQLSSTEVSALSHYQDGGFGAINSSLWGTGGSGSVTGKIKSLDAAIKKSPGLPHDTVLYRKKPQGSELYAWAQKHGVGDIYPSKGFDSTSISTHGWHGDVTLVYRAPKGLKGFFMNTHGYNSSHPGEYEFLLPRNLKWNVVGKKQAGSSIELTLEYAGEF